MNNTIKLYAVSLVSLLILNSSSCLKNEDPNEQPICEIGYPTNGQEFSKGDEVTISVNASDNDGEITLVRFFIDGTEINSTQSFPYTIRWQTSDADVGSHLIKATCEDNIGSISTDEISITLTGGGNTTGSFTDPRDGKDYKTVNIGNQTWMAENLNFETINSWWHGDDINNGNIHGRLYTWEAAMTACPQGWHLPSDDEWKQFELNLGMSQTDVDMEGIRGEAGRRIKSTYSWNENGNGTNETGFNGLASGFRYVDGEFSILGYDGHWWTSTENGTKYAWDRSLHYTYDGIERDNDNKLGGFSVRCLKD